MVAFTFTGIYMTLSKVSRHEKDNRYSVIAANLAQEGIEIIRNRRDENLLNEDNMNDDLEEGSCYPYWEGETAHCDGGREDEMELDSNGIYRNCESSCGSEEVIFERECYINTSEDNLIEATCTVEWISPSLEEEKSITLESYLTNWQEN